VHVNIHFLYAFVYFRSGEVGFMQWERCSVVAKCLEWCSGSGAVLEVVQWEWCSGSGAVGVVQWEWCSA